MWPRSATCWARWAEAVGRATWSPADTAWLKANASGLPPESFPYVHSHQRWAATRRQTERASVMDHDQPWFKVWHSDMSRTERALTWLRWEFGPRA